jgi:hypothetical protein
MNKQELRYNKYLEITSEDIEWAVKYIIELEDRIMEQHNS